MSKPPHAFQCFCEPRLHMLMYRAMFLTLCLNSQYTRSSFEHGVYLSRTLSTCLSTIILVRTTTLHVKQRRVMCQYPNNPHKTTDHSRPHRARLWRYGVHGEQKTKTYNRRDSQMVTHSSTSRPVQCLCMAERTGCPVFTDLWSYVLRTVRCGFMLLQ
jgi:hypothetical protein